jgi:hypothetical protein
MILGLLAMILIVGIALLQLREGLFSALVFTVATLVASAAALGCYRALAAATGLISQSPTLIEPLCLGLLFIAILYPLRFVLDKFIGEDIVYGLWIHRIGAVTLGLFAGTIIVGMLMIVIQLLPFGRNVMGLYQPFGPDLQRQASLSPIPADTVTLGLTEMLSAGALSTSTSLADQHPDLLQEAFCRRNTAGLHGRIDTEPDAMKIIGLYTAQPEDISGEVPASGQLDPIHGQPQILVVRVAINASASGDDDWWRLAGTHFRLHCDCDPLPPVDLYPVGYLYTTLMRREWLLHPAEMKDGTVDLANLAVVRPLDAARYMRSEKLSEEQINLVVDWVYAIPEKATPTRLVFRGTDMAELPAPKVFADQPVQMRIETLTPAEAYVREEEKSGRSEPSSGEPTGRKGKGINSLLPDTPPE